ncbi:MAG TPA: hypothetical protein PKW21_15035 [Rhabdaerophilum sp.]|nr:hypothetical protein [Rhabdaerophilum sp.]
MIDREAILQLFETRFGEERARAVREQLRALPKAQADAASITVLIEVVEDTLEPDEAAPFVEELRAAQHEFVSAVGAEVVSHERLRERNARDVRESWAMCAGLLTAAALTGPLAAFLVSAIADRIDGQADRMRSFRDHVSAAFMRGARAKQRRGRAVRQSYRRAYRGAGYSPSP